MSPASGQGAPGASAGRWTGTGPDRGLRQGQLERITALIDGAFLVEMGWDPDRLVLAPPAGHRLLVRPVCRVEGCSTTATGRGRICQACRRRLGDAGPGDNGVESSSPGPRPRRGPAPCLVAGCDRERLSAAAGLCRAHADQHHALGGPRQTFLDHPAVGAIPPNGPCAVAACPRQRRSSGFVLPGAGPPASTRRTGVGSNPR